MKLKILERRLPCVFAALGWMVAIGALALGIVASAGCSSRAAREVGTAAAGSVQTVDRGPAVKAEPPPAVLTLPATAADLAEILAAGGLSAVRLDAGSVVLRQDDLQVLVFLEDDGSSLQAVLPYLGRQAADLRLLDRWNATRRFGRAYLDHEDGPILASDLLLEPGMPAELVQSWGRLFLAMAAAFRDEVWPAVAPPAVPDNE